MHLTEDSEEDLEAAEEGRRKQRVAADANIECAYEVTLAPGLNRGSKNAIKMEHNGPSLASSKQWLGSQCDVKIVTLCPRFCRPTAASIIRRSAPPMPRSGWKNTMFLGFVIV